MHFTECNVLCTLMCQIKHSSDNVCSKAKMIINQKKNWKITMINRIVSLCNVSGWNYVAIIPETAIKPIKAATAATALNINLLMIAVVQISIIIWAEWLLAWPATFLHTHYHHYDYPFESAMINYHMNLSRLFEHLAHLKGLVTMIDNILCLHVIP